jgi:DnaJ-class molecular chaperone
MSLQYDYEQPGFLLYEELEVSPRASDPVIRAAYGRLMRVHAADLGRVERLKKAFDVLSNPASRSAYDAMGTEGKQTKEKVRYLRKQDTRELAGAGGAEANAMFRGSQMGLIIALSLFSGIVGGLELMQQLAARGALPFG